MSVTPDRSPIEELSDRLARTGVGDYHADVVALLRLLRGHLYEHRVERAERQQEEADR